MRSISGPQFAGHSVFIDPKGMADKERVALIEGARLCAVPVDQPDVIVISGQNYNRLAKIAQGSGQPAILAKNVDRFVNSGEFERRLTQFRNGQGEVCQGDTYFRGRSQTLH